MLSSFNENVHRNEVRPPPARALPWGFLTVYTTVFVHKQKMHSAGQPAGAEGRPAKKAVLPKAQAYYMYIYWTLLLLFKHAAGRLLGKPATFVGDKCSLLRFMKSFHIGPAGWILFDFVGPCDCI